MQTSQTDAWQEKYAISTCLFDQQGFPEALSKIAAAGFHWIEISGTGDHLDCRTHPDLAAARKMLRQTGLAVHSLHTPFTQLKLGHPDRALKQEWLRVVGASLGLGAEIGAPLAIIHVNGEMDGVTGDMYADSRQITLEYIAELQLRAHALGIRLALENMLRLPHHPRRYGTSLQELSRDFPDPEIGFCLDTGHAAVCRSDMAAEIKAAGSRLVTTHIHSNDSLDDCHWLPTRGVVVWRSVEAALVQNGYQGRYLLELKGYGDPEGVLAQAAAFARADYGDVAVETHSHF